MLKTGSFDRSRRTLAQAARERKAYRAITVPGTQRPVAR